MNAIVAEGLSKKYRIGEYKAGYQTLRDTLSHVTRRALRLERVDHSLEDLWALQDVSFTVEEGEVVGFIGKNGSKRPIQLYWGRRCAESDLPYGEELQQYLADGRLQRLQLAFSHGTQPRYVQERLAEDAAGLRTLLEQGGQVLVCGSRAMATGVRGVLEKVLAELGGSLEQLKAQGRYREDVY